MARIRTVKPSFFTSLSNADLPISTRLTFIGLWTYADDQGRGVDDSRLIKAAVWPLDEPYTTKKVTTDMDLLEKAGKIRRYVVDGRRFFAIVKWEHQRIDKAQKSILPAPPGEDDSGNDPGTLQEPDGNDPGTLPPKAGLDRKGIGREVEGNSSAPAKPDASKRATGPPAEFVLDDELRAWAGTNTPTISDELRLQRETERFLDHHRAKGSTFKDWRAAWRTWMNRAVDYAPRALPALAGGVTAQDLSMANVDSVFDQLKEASR